MSMSMTAQNVLQQLAAWVRPKTNIESLVRTSLINFGPALLGIVIFLVLWHVSAQSIDTSLGKLPGPVQVWEQTVNLIAEHDAERAGQGRQDGVLGVDAAGAEEHEFFHAMFV